MLSSNCLKGVSLNEPPLFVGVVCTVAACCKHVIQDVLTFQRYLTLILVCTVCTHIDELFQSIPCDEPDETTDPITKVVLNLDSLETGHKVCLSTMYVLYDLRPLLSSFVTV